VPARGDHDLDPMSAAIAAVRPIRLAAVLVPVIARDEPMVLLTQRTAHLKDHAGQISFPGGKIDSADASPMAAALREAEEEIGLAADRIEPIGYLDLYLTTFGFRIVPMVARIAPEFSLTLNRDEVDDTFEVPLAFLMAPENHHRKSRDWNGLTRHFYEMPFGKRYIWGATAGILRNLYERIYRA
jgi:8-oxo-dGTP pyrophosphatase MutT (NUDIX family)